jgi:hypothetical protein
VKAAYLRASSKYLPQIRKSTQFFLICFAKRDSSMGDEGLQSRAGEETYSEQRTKTIDRYDKKKFLYHSSADDKISAPSDAAAIKESRSRLGLMSHRDRKKRH